MNNEQLQKIIMKSEMEYEQMKDTIHEQQQEIERLNNIIKDLIKDIEIISECEDIDIIKMQLRTCLYNKLKELKENK